ncbi:MAG: glycosyltransferase family 2 protein [Bacteroidota bacterium]
MTNTPVNDKSQYPKVSIIIVTLNVADSLQPCLDSIYKQTYPNIEIVIMDGLSTDGTVDILKANDSRIACWRSEKDGGIYQAMNKGLDYITGDWVYFLGADDILYDDFSTLAYQLKDHSLIYYANVSYQGQKYRGEVTAYQHAKGAVCHQAIIYPKEVFTVHQLRFDPKYKISADHVLNMQCWRKFRFVYVDLMIAFFNDTGVSTQYLDGAFERDKQKLIFKHHGFVTGMRYVIRLMKEKRKPDNYKKIKPTND